jgi:hypothetical protein
MDATSETILGRESGVKRLRRDRGNSAEESPEEFSDPSSPKPLASTKAGLP